MDWILYLVAAVFAVLGALCVAAVVISLPGAWIMLGIAVLIELIDGLWLSDQEPLTFGWWVLGVAAGLAILGELFEFLAGAAGARGGGGTKRGMVGAVVGGILGAILFTFALPLPILGTLIGALVGTFAGAMVGEVTGATPRTVGGSLRPATGATIGRVLGTVGKIGIALVMWLMLTVAAVV